MPHTQPIQHLALFSLFVNSWYHEINSITILMCPVKKEFSSMFIRALHDLEIYVRTCSLTFFIGFHHHLIKSRVSISIIDYVITQRTEIAEIGSLIGKNVAVIQLAISDAAQITGTKTAPSKTKSTTYKLQSKVCCRQGWNIEYYSDSGRLISMQKINSDNRYNEPLSLIPNFTLSSILETKKIPTSTTS